MNMKSFLTTIIVFILNIITVNAQKSDYADQWKKITKAEEKGLTKDASKIATDIFDDASKKSNQAQQIKAAMYMMKFRNMVEEENQQKNIFFIDTLIAKAKEPVKNILQSMQAQLFQTYKEQNRYKLYNRTKLAEQKSNDIDTWSIDKLNNTIANLYKVSLKNDELLKTTNISNIDAILEKGMNTENLRPTLYDFLAHRALDFFMSSENDVTNPSYKFIINEEAAFAPVRDFSNYNFKTKDTASLYLNALKIMQGLLVFHLNDSAPEALLDADLKRLDFVNQHGVFNNKEKLYENALLNIETKYSISPASAQATYLRAQMLVQSGNKYNLLTQKESQFDLVKAIQICEAAYAKFPKSEGGINCKNLLNSIEKPSFHFEVEKVNLPKQPFRALVSFKNIDKIYYKIIKTNRSTLELILNSSNELDDILKLKFERTEMQYLPDQKDYQEHSVEIKIDGLDHGIYFILMSRNKDFIDDNNIISRSLIYISNITYINDKKGNFYILNREDGSPLNKAQLSVWEDNYDNAKRKSVREKVSEYASDKNGLIQIKEFKDEEYYQDFLFQIKYKGDELFTEDEIDSYRNYEQEKEEKLKTFLFTDRSIYRPGQTVFFKGIMTLTDSTGRKSVVKENAKTAVQLFDVNNQKVGSINVTTNEYGSYHGSLNLPEGLLNGSFYLKDTLTSSSQYISVEEYKRPTFYTEIKKPEGSYRLNDSINMLGTAKAYAGNNVDGAKVNYRVVRVIRYPIWYGYYRSMYPSRGGDENMEIANGSTVTDAKGEFKIVFKAIPDETVDKKSQPTFDYKVSADITDNNGETRSATTIVSVSFQAIQLNIIVDNTLPADSLKNIGISSTNANGLHEKTLVNLSMYKLEEPKRIFRPRYWKQPDLFVITKEDYYKQFPYDLYSNENEITRWELKEKVLNINDTTAANTAFNIPNSSFPSGWYKIMFTAKDKFGEEVKAEKFIQLTSSSVSKDAAVVYPIIVDVQNQSAEPGEKITYNISTGFEKIWLIQNIVRPNENYKVTYPTVSKGAKIKNSVEITEADRGSIQMNYVFVQHNRIYNGYETFVVPWTNKQLKIQYQTFRDKLEPGSKEKWKVKITGNNAEKIMAETLISMYDASLDQFKTHTWSGLNSLWPSSNFYFDWRGNTFMSVNSEEDYSFDTKYINVPEKSYSYLLDNGWSYNEGYTVRRSMAGSASRLEDVVVTGYALQGKVAGVNVQIRGNSSISADNKALIIIDGVVATNEMYNKINPQEFSKIDMLKAADATAIYGARAANGVIIISTKEGAKKLLEKMSEVKLRKNFNETAFFFPDLKTDANGNIEFSFTMPEALTKWKMMVLGHTKDLASAYSEKTTITQKQLMVQPNAPRFLREGDRMEFSAKIVNLTDKEITGTSQLELLDAANNKTVDGWFKNIFPQQYFTVPAGQSVAVKFPMDVPFNFNSAMTYRIKAIANDVGFSDGEEAAIPVLTNRMLVTESMPLNMRNITSKNFKFQKLLNSGTSTSLSNHALTIEYTSNPVWYAVQALPYLMEYPYECAEQTFSRYYANTLASFISNSSPKIKQVFDRWKITDTAALMSNLQKNEELKSVLLQETPWVMDAQNETQQKKNIALLFDMVRLVAEKNKTLAKLKEMQSSNGGFVWFKGGRDDRYITQYILTGIGHLRKLKAVQGADYEMLKPIVEKALPYLDASVKEEYDELIKYKVKLSDNHLSYTAIQYLYMRSFFAETNIAPTNKIAVDYYKGQAQKYWLSQSKYMQSMIALALHRINDAKTPKAIIESLKQNSISNEEMGMYWKDFTKGGYYWHQAPIESQAMMVEAFTDIDKNENTVNDLKTWLLKQKQTQNWGTTKATAEACYALLLGGSNWLAEEKGVVINLGNSVIKSTDDKVEAGTGYFKKRIEGEKVNASMGNITVSVKSANDKPINQSTTSWGAAYWQYFEDLDKITSAETPLKLVKKLFIEKNSDKGPILQAIKDGDEINVGDKIKVRIELRADRDMEYVHMKDLRAACMEPINVISEYKYQGGLGYYESTKDASTNFFFGWLPKGTYIFEYPMFVTHTGNFSNGITTIQCMYAPEFTSHSEGVRVSVSK